MAMWYIHSNLNKLPLDHNKPLKLKNGDTNTAHSNSPSTGQESSGQPGQSEGKCLLCSDAESKKTNYLIGFIWV